MHEDIRQTEPTILWNHFADINAIPRASKKEEKIVAFVVDFGKKLGLETIVDDVQNVIIRKPATVGMENRKTVTLQSHLDMVHQKNEDADFDFDTQGIQMEIQNNWIQAKGTTLGADNGIGVAAILSLLSSTTIVHPPLEALFTIDEETGMTGAMGLQPGYLTGDILLNLDTEDDDEISIGCAGGIDITANKTYTENIVPDNYLAYAISVNGLQGGHSGMDIHKGFGNANKIMNRLIFDGFEKFGLLISQLKGGNLRNAIPRESVAIIVIKKNFKESFEHNFSMVSNIIKKELEVQEPSLQITISETETPKTSVNNEIQQKLIQSIAAVHNGVFSMNSLIVDLVETSNNLASIRVENGNIEIACLTRSFSESGKLDLVNSIRSVFELASFEVKISGNYAGWEPNPNSEIATILKATYLKLFKEEPKVMSCHAGLECGILGTHYPNMEMISFGPTIKGAHSPDEKASILSTQKFWYYLQEILKNIPVK